MVDTLNMRLDADEAGEANLLSVVPNYLGNVSEHYNQSSGFEMCTGYLDSLKVSVTPYWVKVKNSSFCKWCLGDNFQTLGRGDIEAGLARLSDALHLSMNKAEITRLDVAKNIILKHPIEAYLSHLGTMPYKERFAQPHSIYYSGGDTQIVFYDKVREQRRLGGNIPKLYNRHNVLRYEVRFLHRLPKALNVPKVTAGLLYDEDFYIAIVKRWLTAYKQIHKINDVDMNWGIINKKSELHRAGLLALAEQQGGQTEVLRQIKEAAKTGELKPKQAHDLREAINAAYSDKGNLTKPNEGIKELDRKIKEATRFYL